MKRKTLFFLLFLFSLCAVFGQDFNVCVYPESEELTTYIETYFSTRKYSVETSLSILEREDAKSVNSLGKALDTAVMSLDDTKTETARKTFDEYKRAEEPDVEKPFDVKLVKYSGADVSSMLEELDPRLLEYVCKTADADFLIMPFSDELAGFIHLTVYIYDAGTGECLRVFERLTQSSSEYGYDVVAALAPFFLTEDEILQLEEMRTVPEIGVFSGLSITSNVEAEVKIDGKTVGRTPFMLEEYTLPIILRFSADGYSDRVVSLSAPRDSLDVTLKPAWMADEKLYTEARTGFYKSFARALGAIGFKAAVSAVGSENQKVTRALDITANGLMIFAAVDLVGQLFDYFRYAEFVSP